MNKLSASLKKPENILNSRQTNGKLEPVLTRPKILSECKALLMAQLDVSWLSSAYLVNGTRLSATSFPAISRLIKSGVWELIPRQIQCSPKR